MRKKKKKWKRKTDNRMRDYGEIDFVTGAIKINKKESRAYGKKKKVAGVLDTIVHEEMHAKHPRMHEKTVRKKAKRRIKKMSRKQKAKQYSKYR